MRDIAYEVGDKVFLKVSPWRKILRFSKKVKLGSRFIRPYEVLERIGPVAYHLALPQELAKLHNVFHVSMLRRYCYDESHILPLHDVQVQEDFSYDEEPKVIMAREVKQLRNKQVLLVSRPDSRSDLIGGSEPSSGCETIYWDFIFFIT